MSGLLSAGMSTAITITTVPVKLVPHCVTVWKTQESHQIVSYNTHIFDSKQILTCTTTCYYYIPTVSVLYTDGRFGVSTTVDSITRISCGRSSQNIKYCSISQGGGGCNSNCPGSFGLKCYCKFNNVVNAVAASQFHNFQIKWIYSIASDPIKTLHTIL